MTFGKKSAALSKKNFDSNPVYYKKYLKTKIKVYNKKPIQISRVIKCGRKVQNAFAYQ